MSSTPRVEIIDRRNVTRDLAEQITCLKHEVWPDAVCDVDARTTRAMQAWMDYDGPGHEAPQCFVIREDDRIIANADTGPRRIRFDGGEMVVLALAGVCVSRPCRGRGYGEAVVRAALDRINRGDYRFGLWQTSVPVRPFYERFGACLAENRFVNSHNADSPDARPWWDEVVMRYPAGEGWPEGTIDLCGPGY